MTSSPSDNSAHRNRDAAFLALLTQHEPHLCVCVHAMIPVWQDAEEVLVERRLQEEEA